MIHEDQSNDQDISTLISLQFLSCEILKCHGLSEFVLEPSLFRWVCRKFYNNNVFGVNHFILCSSILIVNYRVVSPTLNANLSLFVMSCEIILRQREFTTLQLLSFTKQWANGLSRCQSSTMLIHYQKKCRMQNLPKVDELRVNWDDIICKLTHKKCR